jgi:predicted RNA binding protein YcfA (HicA-like mRNA interferase family)
MKNYKVSDIIKIIEKDGWYLARKNGSHRQQAQQENEEPFIAH